MHSEAAQMVALYIRDRQLNEPHFSRVGQLRDSRQGSVTWLFSELKSASGDGRAMLRRHSV